MTIYRIEEKVNPFRAFIRAKTGEGILCEDMFTLDGDLGDKVPVAASRVSASEVKRLIAQGKGLRMLVSNKPNGIRLIVWAGDSNSDIGAMHDTIADQAGMDVTYGKDVPLELSPSGNLRLTSTATGQFDDPREVEDLLDRNPEFQKLFGNYRIDYSVLESESYQPPKIDVGDTIMTGKFKNRKAEVTGFKKDKHAQPVLKTNKGDQQLFKPRLTKIMK